jgi:protein-glutamine gamma-glutamyltransferase
MNGMNSIRSASKDISKRINGWHDGQPVPSPVSITAHEFRSFKFCLTAIVVLSVAAACIENGLHPLVLLTLPVIVAALSRADYGKPYLWSERATTIVFSIYAVVVSAAIVIVNRRVPLPLLIVYFTFGTVLARVFARLTDRNIAQLIFLTVGLVLINCILTNHLLYGFILPVYLFTLMAALALFDAARSRQAASEASEPFPEPRSRGLLRYCAKITVGILFFVAAAFVVLPRPYVMFPALRAAMVRPDGLAEMEQGISYRDMMGMAGRERIAFTADIEEGTLPDFPYWRGRVLEGFDGKSWKALPENVGVPRFIQAPPKLTLTYKFTPYKLQSSTVYVVGLPLRVTPATTRRPLYISPNMEVLVDSPFLVSNSYVVTSGKIPIPSHRRQLRANLSSTGVTPRMEKLAQEWTSAAATPAEKAQAIIQGFTRRYRYALDVAAPPAGVNPLEYFLFQTRAGHCEYFAGAFCLMLRSLGIPARVVEGFAGAEPGSSRDQYVVRFAHAHAWVEAVLGNNEWTTLDPTPPASDQFAGRFWRQIVDFYDRMVRRWIKYVVYFDRSDQEAIRETLTQVMDGDISLTPSSLRGVGYLPYVIAMTTLLVITALLVAYRFRRVRRDPGTLYTSTMRDLVSWGVLTQVHSWHELNSGEIANKCPRSSDAVAKFTNVYLRARFGEDPTVRYEDLAKARDELLARVEEEKAHAA